MNSLPLLWLALTIGLFYLLAVRPQKRLAATRRQLIESLTVGDEVVTAGGILGTIRRLDERVIELEVSPGVTLRLDRAAVVRRMTD